MKQRHFHAHETARMDALTGLPLAGFRQRAVGLAVDSLILLAMWVIVVAAWRALVSFTHGSTRLNYGFDRHSAPGLLFFLGYYALACYLGNGKSPGKWVAKTRVISLTHERMGKWQSFERALGYGASALEGGFGFVQYFIHRNRQTVHDRIAETIVVDESKKATRLLKVEEEEPEAEEATASHPVRAILDGDLGEGDASGSGVAGS
jgi:uncharacterized RDD family membrane protein YckC